MHAAANRFSATFLLLSIAVTSFAQINFETPTRVFSPEAIRNAQEKLKSLNKHTNYKVGLSLSLFYLENTPLTIKADEPIQRATNLSSYIGRALVTETNAATHQFEILRVRADQKAQAFLSRQTNANDIALINITIGVQLYGYVDQQRTFSRQHITLLSGRNVPPSVKQDLTDYLNTVSTLDFNDATLRTNDAILEGLLQHLFIKMIPVEISYADPGKKNLDDNHQASSADFSSFQTQPVPGIPWKCIPADGTFTPVKVKPTILRGNPHIQFRLTNTTDFRLRSPVPDANSFLWISGSAKNKETAIIPSIDGIDCVIQQINVIAYEKIVKELAVVLIEEENDDIQKIPIDTKGLNPDTPVILSGNNHFLDSRPTSWSDDQISFDPVTGDSVIIAGPNGICDTEANNTNIVPPDIDRDALERQLNAFFNPIMVEWKVHKTAYRKRINYDLNKDYLLGLSYPGLTPNGWELIRNPEDNLVNTQGMINNNIPHLFLVDKARQPPGTFVVGVAHDTFESALILTRDMEENSFGPEALMNNMIHTCAHELGHAIFKLVHAADKDETNLMKSTTTYIVLEDNYLRKFQWDIIHGIP